MNKPIAVCLLVLALSGCGSGDDKKAQGAGTVEGEILPGSASDAMVPLDQVKSQAPLAPKAEGSAAGTDKADDKSAKPKVEAKAPVEATAEPAAPE
jgi:hypothetical protein